MFDFLLHSLVENWTVWFVSIVLVVAAIIDGKMLMVPNWLTFPFIISGWVYCTVVGAMDTGFGGAAAGLMVSLLGTFVGGFFLLLLRNRGGMGAGDVKLLAGVGAWLGSVTTLWVFAATAITGGVMAAWMIYRSGQWQKHLAMARQIILEWKTVDNAAELSAIARARKPEMYLLPYGIPMAIGAVIYFASAGRLV